jgi:tetratricopeptide (TPR) repeat protein
MDMEKQLLPTILTLIIFFISINAQTEEFSDPQDYLKESYTFVNKGNHQGAIEVLTRGIEKFPKQPSLYIWRAKYYQWINKRQLMEDDLFKAVEVAEPEIKYNTILNVVGVFMNSRGCLIALKLLNQAISLDSTKISAYASRANVHSCMGNNALALNDINYVLSFDPDNPIALANKNRYLTNSGGRKTDSGTNSELIEELENKIRDNPKNRNLKSQLSILYITRAGANKKENKFEEMFSDYDRAIELHPSSSTYGFRGWQHYQHKNYEKAIEDYTKAIELSNRKTYGYFSNRANLYVLTEQYEKALKDYEMILELLGEQDEIILRKITEVKSKINRKKKVI